jgi:hypothetical protein
VPRRLRAVAVYVPEGLLGECVRRPFLRFAPVELITIPSLRQLCVVGTRIAAGLKFLAWTHRRRSKSLLPAGNCWLHGRNARSRAPTMRTRTGTRRGVHLALKLNRRALLRGAGSVAIALPWLEVMAPERPSRAATESAKHFIGIYTPGGTVLENWRPVGTENEFSLSPILAPLEAVRQQVLIADEVDMTCAVGEQNQAGLIGLWTGTPQQSTNRFAGGPSIDQVLSSRLSAGKRIASLPLAVRWGTGKAHGAPSPIDIANFADTPNWDPITPLIDPVGVWDDLFGVPAESPDVRWKTSMLDAVMERYSKLSQRVGSVDRLRLEQHLAALRELEQQVGNLAQCTPTVLVDTSDYDPASGLNSDDSGSIVDAETDAAIPKVGRLMLDMMVQALSCGITSSTTLMWSDTEAKHTFPWLDLDQHLHFYMNDGGYRPEELTKVFTWYAEQHAYLIQRLADTPGQAGSLLDETVVFIGSHLQHPASHAKTDMPFLLAGRGGGLRGGRWVKFGHRSHNDLLTSILNLCGDSRQIFGSEEYCTGPIGGLT